MKFDFKTQKFLYLFYHSFYLVLTTVCIHLIITIYCWSTLNKYLSFLNIILDVFIKVSDYLDSSHLQKTLFCSLKFLLNISSCLLCCIRNRLRFLLEWTPKLHRLSLVALISKVKDAVRTECNTKTSGSKNYLSS